MRKFQSTFILAAIALVMFSACSQARYGSRTVRVKGQYVAKTTIKQERKATIKQVEDVLAEESTTPEEVLLDQTATPEVLSNNGPVILEDAKSPAELNNTIAESTAAKTKKSEKLSKKLEKRAAKSPRFNKSAQKYADRLDSNEKEDYDAEGLLRDILVILLIVILVSLILSLLPNPLSYWLSVVLTILLILYLIKILG